MKIIVLSLMIAFSTGNTFAKGVGFEELWKGINESSPSLMVNKAKGGIIESQKSRLGRHFFPRLYLNAQALSSNNPTLSFMSKLNQRAIKQADFNPNDLNSPGRDEFIMGTIGIQLPLYEGGGSSNYVTALEKGLEAQNLSYKAEQKKLYSELGYHFSTILNEKEYQKVLNKIHYSVHRLIKKYKLANRSNPVGYSGFLGLKSVLNQVKGYLKESEQSQFSSKKHIEKMFPGLNNSWEPNSVSDTIQFVQSKFPTTNFSKSSLFVQARKKAQQSLEIKNEVQKAMTRPQIGLFAESNHTLGDRDTGDAQTYGLYLKWQLSAVNHGLSREIAQKKIKEEYYTALLLAEEKERKSVGLFSLEALKSSLKLIESNNKMLSQQIQLSKKLYRSGGINGIQLSQVYSNRVQALRELNKIKKNYIQLKTKLHMLSN